MSEDTVMRRTACDCCGYAFTTSARKTEQPDICSTCGRWLIKAGRSRCPDCYGTVVKARVELHDKSGWVGGWVCDCQGEAEASE